MTDPARAARLTAIAERLEQEAIAYLSGTPARKRFYAKLMADFCLQRLEESENLSERRRVELVKLGVERRAGHGRHPKETPMNYDELDPGIRDTVRRLRDAGFDTTDSGDGVSKPKDWYESGEAMPFLHVAAATSPDVMIAQAHRMQQVLGSEWTVEANYSTNSKTAILFARTLVAAELDAALAASAPQKEEPR
jgi:hypothetical protein